MTMRERTALHQILDRRQDISPHTRKACERAIDRFIAFAGPDPRNWTFTVGQAFYDSLRASGMKNGAATTMGHLRHVATWHARQTGQPNFAIVQMSSHEPHEPRIALTPEEAQALLATCETKANSIVDRRDWTMLVVSLETGMRSMSLRGLTWEGISKHRVRKYPIATVPVKGPGGVATYDVPLSDTALAALTAWRKRGASGPVFTGFTRSIGPRGQTALTPNTTAISHPAIYGMLKSRAARAGLRHVHPHLLRHTFITWRGTAGVPMHYIAAITGHSVERQLMGSPKWGELPTYLDETAIADEARNTTPAWLAALVQRRILGPASDRAT